MWEQKVLALFYHPDTVVKQHSDQTLMVLKEEISKLIQMIIKKYFQNPLS